MALLFNDPEVIKMAAELTVKLLEEKEVIEVWRYHIERLHFFFIHLRECCLQVALIISLNFRECFSF